MAIATLGSVIKQVLPESAVARLQLLDHWYRGEPELRLVSRVCNKTRSAVDVGANIGTYTALMRKHAASVVAYEPNPRLAERLARLYSDVRVRSAAVSDAPGTLTLSIPVKSGTSVHELGSVAQSFADEADVQRVTVPAVRLDDEDLGFVGFLKIDAEQHEREVLNGALGMIQRCRPIIMTEATPLLYADGLAEHFRFLTDLGYQGAFTFRGRILPMQEFRSETHANSAEFGQGDFMNPNVFFIPAERTLAEVFGSDRT